MVAGVGYKTWSGRSHVASVTVQFQCYLARDGEGGALSVQKEQGLQTPRVRKCSWFQAQTFR